MKKYSSVSNKNFFEDLHQQRSSNSLGQPMLDLMHDRPQRKKMLKMPNLTSSVAAFPIEDEYPYINLDQ